MGEPAWLGRDNVDWQYSDEDGRTRWVFCDRVGSTRRPHPVTPDLVTTLYNVPRSALEAIYRCRECGQHYFMDYQVINNWDSSGTDHSMQYEHWYPISAEEVEGLQRDRSYELSPRLYLRLGL